MPQFRKGDMFEYKRSKDDVLFVTANSYIRKDGALVMGRGAAKEMKETYLGIDKLLGEIISRRFNHLGKYGVIILYEYKHQNLGVFQVKYHFKDKAQVDLIKFSVTELLKYLPKNNQREFHLNYPGIGNGQLSKEEVEPCLVSLSNNVIIWEKE